MSAAAVLAYLLLAAVVWLFPSKGCRMLFSGRVLFMRWRRRVAFKNMADSCGNGCSCAWCLYFGRFAVRL